VDPTDVEVRTMRGPPAFEDRRDAGRRLAGVLAASTHRLPIVLAMPRGGVPVAAEVAAALGAPLDLIVVRKIGCPWQPELGLGAIAEGGIRVLNDDLIRELGVRPDELEAATAFEREELDRRVRRYRGDRPPIPLMGRDVILVDDGLATGYTARAAIDAIRRAGAEHVTLAVPVAPPRSVAGLARVADEVVAVTTPDWFPGVGASYRDFRQTSDEEVVEILAGAARPG